MTVFYVFMTKNFVTTKKQFRRERHIYVMRSPERKRGSRGLGVGHQQAKKASRALDALLAKTKYTFSKI